MYFASYLNSAAERFHTIIKVFDQSEQFSESHILQFCFFLSNYQAWWHLSVLNFNHYCFLCKWLFFLPLIIISMLRIVARTLSTSHTIIHWMLGRLFTAQLSHKHTTVNFVFQIILIFGHCIPSKLFFSFVFKSVHVLWHSVLLTLTPRANRNIFILLISHKRKKKY